MFRTIVLLISFIGFQNVSESGISPVDFGLLTAKTGEECFEVLYKTHVEAARRNVTVDYSGIDNIDISIPRKAKSIPLTDKTDFRGVKINVRNDNVLNFYLFSFEKKDVKISTSPECLLTYRFDAIEQLKKGEHLLIINDAAPWVENREGYSYGAIRKDILLIKDGKAVNKTIAPYSNATSKPQFSFVDVSSSEKYVRNVTMNRIRDSRYKTFLIMVKNQNQVELSNIVINTPEPSTMNGDVAITLHNCTNIKCSDITINGTYSTSDKYGYGFSMDNVWNSRFTGIKGKGAWGVFGNNNISTVRVENSTLNRFDVHCYGRDFTFVNTKFTATSLPMSSFFGELHYVGCTFVYGKSCAIRPDYNAYTPFDVYYDDCVFYLSKRQNCLIHLANLTKKINKRPELEKKNLPNIAISNCKIHLDRDVKTWELIHVGKLSYPHKLGYISKIKIEGLEVDGAVADFALCDVDLITTNPLEMTLSRIYLLTEEQLKQQAIVKYDYKPSILFRINPGSKSQVVVSDSRLNYNAVENPRYNLMFKHCLLGRNRYYNTNNGEIDSRRSYQDCSIYLNSCDASNYIIDSNADYINCVFYLCDRSMSIVPQTMEKNAVLTFSNCRSIPDGKVLIPDFQGKNVLKSSKLRVQSSRVQGVNN